MSGAPVNVSTSGMGLRANTESEIGLVSPRHGTNTKAWHDASLAFTARVEAWHVLHADSCGGWDKDNDKLLVGKLVACVYEGAAFEHEAPWGDLIADVSAIEVSDATRGSIPFLLLPFFASLCSGKVLALETSDRHPIRC